MFSQGKVKKEDLGYFDCLALSGKRTRRLYVNRSVGGSGRHKEVTGEAHISGSLQLSYSSLLLGPLGIYMVLRGHSRFS
jgi:hypothetical protein